MSGRLDYTDYSGPIVSRKEAIEKNLKRYFTGVRCSNNHLCERYTSLKRCIYCDDISRREFRAKNKDHILNYSRQYYRDNAEVLRQKARVKQKIAYLANPKLHTQRAVESRRRNADTVNARLRVWRRERLRSDPQFRISCNLRRRLAHACKNISRGKLSAVKDAGCTAEFLVEYIESKFDENMTWDNYGSYWHIDHIKPLSAFDLTDDKQFLEACHYTNLQPLEARENIRKGGVRRKKV